MPRSSNCLGVGRCRGFSRLFKVSATTARFCLFYKGIQWNVLSALHPKIYIKYDDIRIHGKHSPILNEQINGNKPYEFNHFRRRFHHFGQEMWSEKTTFNEEFKTMNHNLE